MRWITALVVAVAMFVTVGSVKADTVYLPVEMNVVVTPIAGGWNYLYDVSLGSGTLKAGDFIVLYDFNGYIPGSITATPDLGVGAFATGTSLVGPNPYLQSSPDNASVMNLVWTYQGPDITFVPKTHIAVFTADSIYGPRTTGIYSAQDYALDGTKQGNSGLTAVPVPLPAASVAGLALLGLVMLKRKAL